MEERSSTPLRSVNVIDVLETLVRRQEEQASILKLLTERLRFESPSGSRDQRVAGSPDSDTHRGVVPLSTEAAGYDPVLEHIDAEEETWGRDSNPVRSEPLRRSARLQQKANAIPSQFRPAGEVVQGLASVALRAAPVIGNEGNPYKPPQLDARPPSSRTTANASIAGCDTSWPLK